MKTGSKWIIEIVKTIVYVYFKIFYRLEIVGLDNVPARGRIIICPNHVSSMDMFFIGVKLKRLVRWMAKAELWNNKIVGYGVELLGGFPVHRGKGDVSAIKTAVSLLEQEEAMGIFPEGQRKKSSLKKGYRIHSGASMLAVKTNSPILPVGIEGSSKLFSKVRVVFGKPFYLCEENNNNYSYNDYVEMSKIIMGRVYGLINKKSFIE